MQPDSDAQIKFGLGHVSRRPERGDQADGSSRWSSNDVGRESERCKQKDPALVEIVGEHLFNNMVDDPRFKDFLRKMNLPEWPKLTAMGT